GLRALRDETDGPPGTRIEVGRGDPSRYDDAPRLDDQRIHLGLVDRPQTDARPVVPEVGRVGHAEFIRLGLDQPRAQFLGKSEAHGLPVAREGDVHDPSDPELDPTADQVLLAPRQRSGEAAHIGDRYHQLDVTETALRQSTASPATARTSFPRGWSLIPRS